MTTTEPTLPRGWHAHWMEKPCPLARCGAKAGEPCHVAKHPKVTPEWPHAGRYTPTKEERKAAYAEKERAFQEASAAAERQREEARRRELEEWPDGQPENAEPRRWVRQFAEAGGCVHHYSGDNPRQWQPLPYALARVHDTGRSFRWEVFHLASGEPFDEGYARTLSVAKAKAEKCYDEEMTYYKERCAAERAARAWYLE